MTGQEFYLYILNSNIINFIIMVGLLVLIFKKAKLGNFFNAITDDIKNNVTSSAEAVKNALYEYKKTKKDLKNIDSRKQEIINSALETSNLLKENNKETIKKKEQELFLASEKSKEAFYQKKMQKTTEEIQNAIYTLTINTIKNMDNNEMQEKLILKALDEFDKIEGVQNW